VTPSGTSGTVTHVCDADYTANLIISQDTGSATYTISPAGFKCTPPVPGGVPPFSLTNLSSQAGSNNASGSKGAASSTTGQTGSPHPNQGQPKQTTNQPVPKANLITLTLKYGSHNQQVTWLQDLLKKLGFFPQSVKSNGNFGPTTRQSTQKFQCQYKIVCSGNERTTGYGQVGPKTRADSESICPLEWKSGKPLPRDQKKER
jgi:hypothetical protein